MQKAIKCSKYIAWIGIILNAIVLFMVFILYNDYFDALWIDTGLNILYQIAIIGQVMMLGGIFGRTILEYKLGARLTRQDLIYILVAAAIVGIYYVAKLFFIK